LIHIHRLQLPIKINRNVDTPMTQDSLEAVHVAPLFEVIEALSTWVVLNGFPNWFIKACSLILGRVCSNSFSAGPILMLWALQFFVNFK